MTSGFQGKVRDQIGGSLHGERVGLLRLNKINNTCIWKTDFLDKPIGIIVASRVCSISVTRAKSSG